MRMARWIVVFVMAVALGSPLKGDAQSPIAAKDAAEIRAALNGIQAAWNHHDMTAFVSYMTDDVEWVNIVGMCWRGKAQVFLAHDRMQDKDRLQQLVRVECLARGAGESVNRGKT